jgi:hypothetical protein
MLRQDKVTLRRGQEQHVTGLGFADEDARDGSDVADRDGGILAGRSTQGVGTPVAHAVELDADPGPLSGLVRLPAAARAEVDGGGVRRFGDHLGDHAAKLAGRKDGIEKREDVLRRQRGCQNRRGAYQLAEPNHIVRHLLDSPMYFS